MSRAWKFLQAGGVFDACTCSRGTATHIPIYETCAGLFPIRFFLVLVADFFWFGLRQLDSGFILLIIPFLLIFSFLLMFLHICVYWYTPIQCPILSLLHDTLHVAGEHDLNGLVVEQSVRGVPWVGLCDRCIGCGILCNTLLRIQIPKHMSSLVLRQTVRPLTFTFQ